MDSLLETKSLRWFVAPNKFRSSMEFLNGRNVCESSVCGLALGNAGFLLRGVERLRHRHEWRATPIELWCHLRLDLWQLIYSQICGRIEKAPPQFNLSNQKDFEGFFSRIFFSSFRYFAPILRKRIYHLGDSYDSQDGIVLLKKHRGASLLNNCQSGFTFNGHTLYYCQMVRWSFYLFSVKSTLFSLLSLLFHVFLQLLSSSIFKVQFQMYK